MRMRGHCEVDEPWLLYRKIRADNFERRWFNSDVRTARLYQGLFFEVLDRSVDVMAIEKMAERHEENGVEPTKGLIGGLTLRHMQPQRRRQKLLY